jgi:hypothetical protein
MPKNPFVGMLLPDWHSVLLSLKAKGNFPIIGRQKELSFSARERMKLLNSTSLDGLPFYFFRCAIIEIIFSTPGLYLYYD